VPILFEETQMIKRFWLRVKSFFWNLYGTLLLKTKFKLDDDMIESILMHMDMRYGTNNIVLYTTGTFEPEPVTRAVLHPDDPENGKIFTIPVRVRHRKPLTPELYSQIREYVSKGLYTPGTDPIPSPQKVKYEISSSSGELEQRRQQLKSHTDKSRMNLFIQRVFGGWSTAQTLELYQNKHIYSDLLKDVEFDFYGRPKLDSSPSFKEMYEFPPMHGEETLAE